jgi:hypothetical protein
MKHKSETRQNIMNFVHMIENQFNSKLKIIRSDNGIEFSIPSFYASKGILHQTTCVETPEQNGRVERKHQHLLNVGRALLFHAKLPKKFWSYAISHSTFLINRIPTHILNNKSPYELLHKELPDLSSVKVFGSLTYASTIQAHRRKFEPRSRTCVFLGYKQGVKGSILYDINSKEVFISRNVTHYDHILPYHSPSSPHWHYHTSYTSSDYDTNPVVDCPITPKPAPINSDSVDTNDLDLSHNTPSTSTSPIPNNDIVTPTPNVPAPPIRPIRDRHAPKHLSDYICNHSSASAKPTSQGTMYPISAYHSLSQLSPTYHAYTMSLTHIT